MKDGAQTVDEITSTCGGVAFPNGGLRHEGYLFGAALGICVLALVVAAGLFLPQQALYTDETTHLQGLTLGPIEVVHWLAGEDADRFAGPADRMPPLSYWVGMAWQEVAGGSEESLRWMGVLSVVLAVCVVFTATYRVFGLDCAFIAGLFFALSPNVVVQAVELRPYPLFLLFSALAFWCLTGYWHARAGRDVWWLAGVAVSLILAFYTHFFGLALAAGVLTAALAGAWSTHKRLIPVLVCGTVVGLSAAGLIPFVMASGTVDSGVPTGSPQFSGLVRLVYRLCMHVSIAVSRPMTVIALISFAFLIFAVFTPKPKSMSSRWAVLISLGIGFAITATSLLVASRFDPLKPSYSVWMLPGVAMLLGSSVAATTGRFRVGVLMAAGLLIASGAYGCFELDRNGSHFAHSPSNQLRALLERLDPDDTAIVYDHGCENTTFLANPIVVVYGERVEQYAPLQEDPAGSATVQPIFTHEPPLNALELDTRRIIVINTRVQNSSDVARQVRSGDEPINEGPIAQLLASTAGWKKVETALWPASLVSAKFDVFEDASGEWRR